MNVSLPAVWRDYRNRRRVLVAALVLSGIVPGLRAALAGASRDLALDALAALAITILTAALAWFAMFRCPYCARPFHWTWLVANPWSRECLHCGFTRWRDPHAARQYAPDRG